MKSITIPELHAHYEKRSTKELFLDVRTPEEFAAGSIPGSRNIPFDQVIDHASELKKFDTLYIYCKGGPRAEAACEMLAPFGFKDLFCVDYGGFPNWKAAGFETE